MGEWFAEKIKGKWMMAAGKIKTKYNN